MGNIQISNTINNNNYEKIDSVVLKIWQKLTILYQTVFSVISKLYKNTSEVFRRKSTRNDDVRTKTVYDLPGPIGYPVIGTLLDYFRVENRGKVHELHQRRHAQYGKIIKERLGMMTNVNIADPELVEELSKQEGRAPFRPPYQAWTEYNESRGHRPGLMTAQGEQWSHLRKSMSKYLLPQRCAQTNLRAIDDVMVTFVNRLRRVRDTESRDNVVPQLCNELYLYSLESIVSVLLDSRLGCLEEGVNVRAQNFIQATTDIFETGFKMLVGARYHRWLGTSWWRRHSAAWDTILHTSQELIQAKLREIDAIKDSDPESMKTRLNEMGLLGQLLGDARMSLDDICTNTSELMGGGIDSTSNALAFTLYEVAANPEVQERLYDEVMEVTRGDDFRLEHLQHVPFAKHVLKETLRLHPVIPIDARILINDVTMRGHKIPAGTCVLLNTYTMARDPEIYSKPDQFVPDRWTCDEPGVENCARKRMYSWIPFGFGGRSCVGRRIAETEIIVALCSIVQNFRIRPHSSLVLNPTVRTVMTPGNQLNIVFDDRV